MDDDGWMNLMLVGISSSSSSFVVFVNCMIESMMSEVKWSVACLPGCWSGAREMMMMMMMCVCVWSSSSLGCCWRCAVSALLQQRLLSVLVEIQLLILRWDSIILLLTLKISRRSPNKKGLGTTLLVLVVDSRTMMMITKETTTMNASRDKLRVSLFLANFANSQLGRSPLRVELTVTLGSRRPPNTNKISPSEFRPSGDFGSPTLGIVLCNNTWYSSSLLVSSPYHIITLTRTP